MSVQSSERGPAGLPVNMVRPHMCDIPQFAFPEGFDIRTMHGDESAVWTEVQRDSEPFGPIAADLFMMPSHPVRGELAEGLGLAFLEAAAAGVPSVGTSFGGIPDAIADG